MSFIGKTLGKIVGQSKNANNSDLKSLNVNQDSQLTLTHLRKVFYEYLHPKGDQLIKEEKLYTILPLFIKAFSQSSLSDINDKFDDVDEFCFSCSRLLVNEIGKRVHDDSVLVKFFEMKCSDEATDGAGLLNTVNLLASGPPFLIEIMNKCSLPSRLVMCVYLFICLPEPKDSILDHCEFNAKERRILFQKCFHQLLIKLCQNSCTCDELVDGDSLKLLFTIICSTCEQHNVAWRQTATDALLTLTKNFSSKSINYVHSNECIKQSLRCLNPGEICSANLIERADLLISLLTFIRETSITSQILLEDFHLSSGYKILVDLVLLLEKEISKQECRRTLRNLFFTIEEFVSAGSIELRPNSTSLTMFKIEGFQIPSPQGKGRTVRNVNAFQCLLHMFNRVQTVELCMNVLETIRNIYAKDECNYFILESQNLPYYGLDDTSMKVHTKNNDVQLKFIEVLEFIIYGLKFVPCKELVSIGLSIRNFNNSKWSVTTANFLLKLIQANSVYKDAFRELGILEMLVSCLQKFASLLKEKCADPTDLIQIDSQQKELGFTIINILTCLLSHNIENCKLFRQIGGARVAHNMVPYKFCREQALSIVSTLLLTTAGEDDMSTLLGLMQTAKMEDLELKNSVLKSLLGTLRESHRTRTVFRKSGGFVYVVSVLISMEGSLNIPARSPWDSVKKQEIFSILKTIMNTLTVSMRYEPANAKYFETEVRWKSLCAALRLLGCFESEVQQFPAKAHKFVKRGYDFFETYFCTLDESCFKNINSEPCSNSNQLDPKLIYICYIMRLLYDTALDVFDRPFSRQANRQSSDSQLPNAPIKPVSMKRSSSFLQNIANPMDEPFIIHAGAISSIFHLLTSVPTSNYEMAYRLQFNIINLIKNLLKFERNQQIMSSNLFVDDLLFTCKHVLNDETHFLNGSIQHIFERLACQYISCKNLKEYLRLGTVFDSSEQHLDIERQALVPLSRVKCLISMTSPRENKQFSGVAFVEFNMMVEGFGCLFLPSISPQLSNAPSIVAMGMVSVGNDLSVNGGVGTGERVFPPQSGLTYSTWIYIEKFPSSSKSSHPIQILTLIKHSRTKDSLSSCLCVYLSPKNRSLFINTEEVLLQQLRHDEKTNDYSAKFNCSELFQEGQWLHLCIVFSRAVLKNSTVSLFVNCNLIGTQKLNYLNSIIMPNTPPSSISIHGVIGTLPMFRSQSSVIWRQASCYLIEDIITHQNIQLINDLGPDYIGSFQSLDSDNPSCLFAEEKLMFGLHPSKMFEMTLAKFRSVYNKNDSKSIGKQLNIPSNESVTPLRILSNTAVQLQGASRTVGGVVIGYMGVRVFQPMPVYKSIENLGGASFLLALISMSADIEFMYASVKCLACCLKANSNIEKEMDRMHGYQLLSMLLKRKKTLINSHVLNLTFSLAISDDSPKETINVFNLKAFEYLVCDLDIWYECSSEIGRCLHDKLNELMLNDAQNIKLFHRLKMLKRILYTIVRDTTSHVLSYALQTIKILITECVHSDDLLTYAHFLASLVPDYAEEKESNHVILLRESLLDIIDELITQNTTNKSYNFQEELVKIVGFDWFILFMNRKCVPSTILKSAKILFTLLLNHQNLNKFLTSTYNGAWLSSIINADGQTMDTTHIQTAHGFQLIQANFCKYPHQVQLYYLLFALLFDAQKINNLTSINNSLDLNKICKFVFDKSFDSEQNVFSQINVEIAIDIALIVFSMVRNLMNTSSYESTVKDYAIILMQIFRFMYHNCDDFCLLSQNSEFLSALILTVYPYEEIAPDELALPPAVQIQPFAEAISTENKKPYKTYLCNHPARKLVVDFLRDLLYDSIVTKPNCSLIDLILSAIPADSQLKRSQEFTTELLKTTMDHLLSSDLFTHNPTEAPTNTQLQSFINFIDRLVDKLYEGMHRRDAREIIDSLIKLYTTLRKKLNTTHESALLNSIHRAVLFQLSRPCFNLTEQINMLDILHKIQNNKALVFSNLTHSDFYSCLAYCLLLITNDGEETEARSLVNSAAQRVWLELYLNKKSQLEESLRISLSAARSPNLDELRFVLEEPCARVWSSYWDRKTPDKIHTQIQAKLSRVTGGISNFTRVVSLKKPKKEQARIGFKELDEILVFIDISLKHLKDFVNADIAKYARLNEQKDAYLLDEWIRLERDLLRDRALWGQENESALDKWKLDFTEGPNRMRKKLLNNTNDFYKMYKIEFDSIKASRKYKIAQSAHAKQYLVKFRVKSLLNFKQNISEYLSVRNEIENVIQSSVLSHDNRSMDQSSIDESSNAASSIITEQSLLVNETNDETNSSSSSTSTTTNHNIARLLEDGEKINHIYRCARVTGLDTTEGLFLFGKEHFYVLDGYTLISSKDIVDIDTLKNSSYEPLIPKYSSSSSSSSSSSCSIGEKSCSKFAYEDIREVHNRRYLLQEIAMEIFSNDGRNFLLVFPRKCRQKIYERLIALTPDLNGPGSQSIAGQGRTVQIEQNNGIFNALIGEKSVVQRWERGEITNFQYLMFLNTLAGRSYNDLMQYPVFPWILSDYDSNELDFSSPFTFRDLSKPMGAQNGDRLRQFEKRFVEWEDPSGETPPYHYGTHYSSAMIVASYLVRMEPFTQIFLKLQGGHFDLADRMFHSVKDAWLSASKNNMADVKELLPEFFYLPEFLVNSNRFDLGKKQNGVELNDVVLPPWAKNDPREFVRVHRMALESDYVSAHLNEWIDLIFGYKQQGQAAVESNNVFHHLFYEGAVNIDQIDDPLKRNAIIGFINNFGQIPKQLFKKPHPVKKLNTQLLYSGLNLIGSSIGNTVGSLASNLSAVEITTQDKAQPIFIHYLKSLKPSLQPIKELKSQIGQIVCTDKGILVVEQNKFVIPPTYQRYIAWGFADQSIRIGYTDYEKSYTTFENLQNGAVFCCCSTNAKTVITAGQSSVVNVWHMNKIKPKKLVLKTKLYGHIDTITCMAVSNNYHMLITGSRDQSCIIWDINRWTYVRQLTGHYTAVSAICINELTGDIATASASYLYLWSINGELLASINTISSSRNHVVLCVQMSHVNEWDANNVILTGGTDGVVRMWSLDYVQVCQNDKIKTQSTLDCSDNPLQDDLNHSPIEEDKKILFKIEESDKSNEIDDDFVVIDSIHNESNRNALKPGYKWKRELMFRSKLTMHTSYDRKDNYEPASVTALAISKDNKTIYVGDSRGRVFSWVCIENPGKTRADHWVKDDSTEQCRSCHVKFSFSERKHHCRDCGGLYCNQCTKYEIDIPKLNINKPVRVCQQCFSHNSKADLSLNSSNHSPI